MLSSPVCGTTGKRKACKDCSCGLAEELDAGKPPKTKSVTSSCGSVSRRDRYCGDIGTRGVEEDGETWNVGS